MKCGYLPSWWKKESSLVSVVNMSQYRDTHSEDTIANVRDTVIFPLFGAVSSKQHTVNTICTQELASFFLTKPVFIPPWTIPRKYLQSANLPLAMSQMAAMKMSRLLLKKAHSTRNNDAFTHCDIPLFLQTHYIRNIIVVQKVWCFSWVFISAGKQHPLWSSFQETHIRVYIRDKNNAIHMHL